MSSGRKVPPLTRDIYSAVQRLKIERNEKREGLVKLRTRLHATEREAVRKERTVKELNRLRHSNHPISKVLLRSIGEESETQNVMFGNKCLELREDIDRVGDEIGRVKRTGKFTHLVELQAELAVWRNERERLKRLSLGGRSEDELIREATVWQKKSQQIDEEIVSRLIPTIRKLEAAQSTTEVEEAAEVSERCGQELERVVSWKAEVANELEAALVSLEHRRECRGRLEEVRKSSAELVGKTESLGRAIDRIAKGNMEFALSGDVYELAVSGERGNAELFGLRQMLIDRAEKDEEWRGLLRLLGETGGSIGREKVTEIFEKNDLPSFETGEDIRTTDFVFGIDLAARDELPPEPQWQEIILRWRARCIDREEVRQALLLARSSEELLELLGEEDVVRYWQSAGSGRAVRTFDAKTVSWHKLSPKRIAYLLGKCRNVTKGRWRSELKCPLEAVGLGDLRGCGLISSTWVEDIFVMLLSVGAAAAEGDEQLVDLNYLYDVPVETFVSALREGGKVERSQVRVSVPSSSQESLVEENKADADEMDLFSLDRLGGGLSEEAVGKASDLPDLGSLFGGGEVASGETCS
ncbi:hypothetical protein FOL47_002923 [Perkinsus chesapeaki]|uniref:Uncharacterized protein n=1 Tax=Perkinsus chesapeaki TaxID=330153 RepID=A0A7J6MAM4_PERCH|nr:hypothetical protein FOL47_002923 [Perkinsus chesapeaki]